MTGKYWMVMAAGTLALLADAAQAAVSGQIHARLTLIAGCEVTNSSNPSRDRKSTRLNSSHWE